MDSGRQNKEQSNLVGVDRAERERETDSSEVVIGSPTSHLVPFRVAFAEEEMFGRLSRNGRIPKTPAD